MILLTDGYGTSDSDGRDQWADTCERAATAFDVFAVVTDTVDGGNLAAKAAKVAAVGLRAAAKVLRRNA